MLCLHQVHFKLPWGMPLLKASKCCPKKIFWSWCFQKTSLWRRGEERLATFFVYNSDTVMLETIFWHSENVYRKGSNILCKLSIFLGNALNTQHKSQNVSSHIKKIIPTSWLCMKYSVCLSMTLLNCKGWVS